MTPSDPPPEPPSEPPVETDADQTAREQARRRRRRDVIFGDELHERDAGAGRDDEGRDADILRDVPPHHT